LNITPLPGSFYLATQTTAISHYGDVIYFLQDRVGPCRGDITGGTFNSYDFGDRFRAINYPTKGIIVNNYLHVACGSQEFGSHLSTVDITNPFGASCTDKISLWTAHCFSGNNKLIAYSFGTQYFCYHPDGPSLVQKWYEALSSDISGIAVTNSYMYVALKSPDMFKVYSISDFPDSLPAFINDVWVNYSLRDLLVNGNALYGFTSDSMVIYDLTDPTSPAEYDVYGPLMDSIEDCVVSGKWLFLLMPARLEVFDATDPLNPTFVESLTLPHAPMLYMTQLENYLAVCDPNHHPVFIDISDPSAPTIFGEPITTDKFYTIRDLIAHEGFLYELTDSMGIRIFRMFD